MAKTHKKARVYNDHTADYFEEHKGQKIIVPSKGYIVMRYKDAANFLGSFTPIIKDAAQKDVKPKMLRMVLVDDAEEVTTLDSDGHPAVVKTEKKTG